MGLIDDERGVMGAGQGEELREGRDVAVHAEKGLGDEKAAAGGGTEVV